MVYLYERGLLDHRRNPHPIDEQKKEEEKIDTHTEKVANEL